MAELGGCADHIEVVAAEHHGKGFAGLLFDRKGMSRKTVELARLNGLAHILDPVRAFVSIVITRPSIRDEDDNFTRSLLIQ